MSIQKIKANHEATSIVLKNYPGVSNDDRALLIEAHQDRAELLELVDKYQKAIETALNRNAIFACCRSSSEECHSFESCTEHRLTITLREAGIDIQQ